jgi:hypothetical protein
MQVPLQPRTSVVRREVRRTEDQLPKVQFLGVDAVKSLMPRRDRAESIGQLPAHGRSALSVSKSSQQSQKPSVAAERQGGRLRARQLAWTEQLEVMRRPAHLILSFVHISLQNQFKIMSRVACFGKIEFKFSMSETRSSMLSRRD